MTTHAILADKLVEAFGSANPIAPGPDLPDLSLAEGYAVQHLVSARFQNAGRRPIGWKIGHTSPEPMVGIIYADSLIADGALLDLASVCAPKVEGEVLLQLASVPSADADDAALVASLASVELAIEIADSRIAGWPGQLAHGIADNASSGRVIRSDRPLAPSAIDLTAIEMRLLANGETIAEGRGDNCMGGALNVYRWFVRDSAERGRVLRSGDIVLTGSMALPTPMAANTSYEVIVEGLGKLGVRTGEAVR